MFLEEMIFRYYESLVNGFSVVHEIHHGTPEFFLQSSEFVSELAVAAHACNTLTFYLKVVKKQLMPPPSPLIQDHLQLVPHKSQ